MMELVGVELAVRIETVTALQESLHLTPQN